MREQCQSRCGVKTGGLKVSSPITDRMPTSYYERNRERICARMRELDAERRTIAREARETDGTALDAQRQAWRIKYARRGQKSVKARIDALLDDPCVSETFKAFLQFDLLLDDNYRFITLRTLNELASLSRQTSDVQIPCNEVDGDSETRTEPSQTDEEASEETETAGI